MRILHYSLGLPPNRSGGLTKYATDLMLAQQENNNIVSLLYPGDYTFWKLPKKKIVQRNSFRKIAVYEIENPCPAPLLHGLNEPLSIVNETYKLSNVDLERFYEKVKPEVIHVHTLMGLAPEILSFFKNKGVKIIFTSHDYFGLCLKVNFINQDSQVCQSPVGTACELCNRHSKKTLFLRLRNSSYLLKYKDKFSLNIKTSDEKVASNSSNNIIPDEKRIVEYGSIIQYYHNLLNQIDCFHFNSSIAKEQYEKFIDIRQAVVLPISHAGIKDSRKLKVFDHNHIRLAFIGHKTEYKGFPMLKNVLCKLNDAGIDNWSLDVWGGIVAPDPENGRICYKGKFSHENLKTIYDEIDLLIVPSIWKETFSLITLEALSYGVPVMVSSNVGAKDIIKNYNSDFIFNPSHDELSSTLEIVLNNPSILENFNQIICSGNFDYLLDDHILKIKQLYKNTLMS